LYKKAILGLSSFQFMVMVRRGLFYAFLSIYLNVRLGLSVTETTLLASLTMIANSTSQTFVWGRVSDKYQARASLIVIGETTAAFGYIMVYLVHAYMLGLNDPIAAGYSIIGGLAFLEFFWSMSNLGWSALVSDLTTSKERGRLMSLFSSIGGVGRILGVSVSALMYDWGGEAGGFTSGLLFYFASGIMLASAVLVWISARDSETVKEYEEADRAANNQSTRLSNGHGSNAFRWLLMSTFIVGLGAFSILQILILYAKLDSPIGATDLDIAMIRNSSSIAIIVTSLLAGFIAHRIGRKRALGLGFGLMVVTPLFYMIAQNAVQMIIINSLNGVARALMTVVGYLVASDLIPAERRGRLFGQYNAVTSVSFGLAGTVLGGPIADYLISTGVTKAAAYVAVFQVASAVALVGTLTFATKVKPKRKGLDLRRP
jgi:MFS family permease